MKLIKLPLIIIVLAVSWLLGWALSAAFNSSVGTQQINVADDNRISELNHQIAELRNKLIIIKADWLQQAKNDSPVSELTSTKVPVQHLSRAQTADNSAAQEFTTSAPDNSSETKSSVEQSAYEKFLTERVDYDWAVSNEKKLKEAFYTDVNLQAKELKSVVCKATACEIKIHLENKDELSNISGKIMSRLKQKDLDVFAPIIWNGYSEKENSAAFYIEKK
ncbi:hypothetical protein [Cellvibrio sp.]|uniref:hypothetical protein n=1 Tax=Cellvibrio sp. TaxID=1965322 RepID=UPI0039647BEE